jgi:hypothetical protein
MEASVNNPQDRGQRISHGGKFPADKNRIAAASTTHIARKSDASADACGLDSESFR